MPMPRWQDRSSRAVHFLFYVVILGMAASGIGMMVLSGATPIIFGGKTPTLPYFWDYLPRRPHGIGARLIPTLLVAHAGAALYHHIYNKDGLASDCIGHKAGDLPDCGHVRAGSISSTIHLS